MTPDHKMNAFVGVPQASMMSAARGQCNSTPTCSAISRRTALRIASLAVSAALLPQPARALSLNEKKIITNMDKVSLALDKAKSLKSSVEQWNEPLTEDDGLYVLRFIPIWLEPARVSMVTIATQSEVIVGDQGVAKQFADATLGHLFELKAEAKGRKKEGVIRELDEFVETADGFLSIPELQNLKKR